MSEPANAPGDTKPIQATSEQEGKVDEIQFNISSS